MTTAHKVSAMKARVAKDAVGMEGSGAGHGALLTVAEHKHGCEGQLPSKTEGKEEVKGLTGGKDMEMRKRE